MNSLEHNYISIEVKNNIDKSIEIGLLVGLKKLNINNIEESFLILLIDKYTLKLFNMMDYTLLSAVIKLSTLDCVIDFTTKDNKINFTIEKIIEYMDDNKETITKELINIDLYKNFPISNMKHNTVTKTDNLIKKEPSVFIIKRKIPLLNKEHFLILHNRAHLKSN